MTKPSRRAVMQMMALALGGLTTAFCAGILSSQLHFVESLRNIGFDTMQRMRPRLDSTGDAVQVIDIDEKSIAALGQWPWPRDTLAALVDALNAGSAKVIVFDMIFPEADRASPSELAKDPRLKQLIANNGQPLPDNDALFAQAISRAPVVVAASAADGASNTTAALNKASFATTGELTTERFPQVSAVTSNLATINAAAQGIGMMNIDLAASGGIAREVPLVWSQGETKLPSLALEAIRLSTGSSTIVLNGGAYQGAPMGSVRVGPYLIPTDARGNIRLYYRPDAKGRFISAAALLDPGLAAGIQSRLAGRIVLIGTSAIGLFDSRTSVLGKIVPGVSVHAQEIEQVLSSTYLSRPEWAKAVEFFYLVVAGAAITLLSLRARPRSMLTAFLAVCLFAIFTTAYAFLNSGILLDAVIPIISIVAVFLAVMAFKLFVLEANGRALRRAFAFYVAEPVVAQLERNPDSVKLGGEQREVTVMFVDIQSFSALSAALNAEHLIATTNAVLGACTATLIAEGGTLDKYIGDALLAFWNAPLPQAGHQAKAAKAALGIQAQIGRLNQDGDFSGPLKAAGLWPLDVRIGLATGPAVVGNMGSAQRFDYSVLGETVNLASRAQLICKDVGAPIVIAGPIQSPTDQMALLDCGHIKIRGLAARTACHGVFGLIQDNDFMSAQKAMLLTIGNPGAPQVAVPKDYQKFMKMINGRRQDYEK